MMQPKPFKGFLSLALIAALFAAGCGDDDGGPTDGGPADTDPPAISLVTALDGSHVEIVFDEDVQRDTAQRREHYQIVEVAPSASAFSGDRVAPGDTIRVGSAVLGTDDRTVTLQTDDQMNNAPYELTVRDVEDLSGNRIGSAGVTSSFTGSDAADTTPPTILSRSPGPGNTGVAVGTPVVVQFSERMNQFTLQQAFSWSSSGGPVAYDFEEHNANEFIFTPITPLSLNTEYTVTISATAEDFAGNNLTATTWSFTTTPIADTTPPRVTSISPANGATNVSVNTVFRLNFSEAINQNDIEVIIVPDPGDGIPVWSNGGRTVTFEPFEPLLDNTQYSITIPPGGFYDLAGNANTDLVSIVFTTGSSLASGRITGTLSGDPLSATASNPQGAIVFAASSNPFADSGGDGPPDIVGTTIAGAGGSYSIGNLPDDTYFLASLLDSNDDGIIDPEFGDAIGVYGVDFVSGFEPDSVTVSGGATVTGVDFGLIDPPTIAGVVSYIGSMYAGEEHAFGVAVFDTGTWNPSNPTPDHEVFGFLPFSPEYRVNGFDDGLDPGVYYVGAYFDVDDSGGFTNGVDPLEFFGDLAPVNVMGGADVLDVDIDITDNTSLPSVAPWLPLRPSPPDPARQRIADVLRVLVADGVRSR